MSFHVYNTKQQSLNAEKLAELFSFISNDFSGLVSNEQTPIQFGIDEETHLDYWCWNPNLDPFINFIGGGINIGLDFPRDENIYKFINSNSLYGIDIIVPSDNSSISTDVYNLAHIDCIPCSDITVGNLYIIVNNPLGDPSLNGYYEYILNPDTGQYEYILSEDTQVDTSKVYYYEIENNLFSVLGAKFRSMSDSSSFLSDRDFDYYGNTIWIDKSIGRFFIPICGKDKDGNVISMIFNRDKAGYESFLSARTYYSLLKELSNKFVFRVGGKTLGDIGELNVTDNNITNRFGNTVNIDSTYLNNVPVMSDSSMLERFEKNTNAPVDRYTGLLMFSSDTNDSNNSMAKEGRIYRISNNYMMPINHGGTAASEKDTARKNLNFYSIDTTTTPVSWSTTDPTERTVNPKKEDGTPDYGAIWFKIIE